MKTQELLNELIESLVAKEYGDARSILDEMIEVCAVFPQKAVDDILQEHTGQLVRFTRCPVDGWGYDEFDENGVLIDAEWYAKRLANQ